MAVTRNYSPADNNVIIDGNTITGFGDADSIKATRNEDEYMSKVGNRGQVARSHNLNLTGEITIGLLQTEPDNDVLSAMQDGRVVSISINDNNSGSTNVRGTECWLKKPADFSRGKEAGVVEYTFTVAKLTSFQGGSIV